MRSRPTRPLLIGLAAVSLTGCATRSPIVEVCPQIPDALTEPCRPTPREIVTNGDLARAYVDAQECVEESTLKLRAIRDLAGCRADVQARAR